MSVALIEMHGGSLSLESAPGKGTAVTLHVPIIRVIGTSDPDGSMVDSQ